MDPGRTFCSSQFLPKTSSTFLSVRMSNSTFVSGKNCEALVLRRPFDMECLQDGIVMCTKMHVLAFLLFDWMRVEVNQLKDVRKRKTHQNLYRVAYWVSALVK